MANNIKPVGPVEMHALEHEAVQGGRPILLRGENGTIRSNAVFALPDVHYMYEYKGARFRISYASSNEIVGELLYITNRSLLAEGWAFHPSKA